MKCPKCRETDLVEEKMEDSGVRLDVCPKCMGIWFDAHELEQILDVAARELRPPSKSVERRCACPKCAAQMTAFNYPQTLVVVDMCKTCKGIWLDGNEFAEIKTIREQLRRQNLLEAYAPVPGAKGTVLRFIEGAIDSLKFWT